VRRGSVRYLLIIPAIAVGALLIPREWFLSGLTVHKQLQQSEAIVLVGGAFTERAPAAAMLYREGYAPLVILANDGVFSGWSTKYHRNLYQVEWAAEYLIGQGVPRDRIVMLPFYGSATVFDALAVKRYLLTNKLKKIIVVTSDYHTRRAFWVFKNVVRDYTGDISIFPARSFSIETRSLAMEYVKLGYYFLRYGILGLLPQMNEIPLKVR